MDRYLKERLVGAAVLVAAAIILIPEMLSGPHDGAPSQADLGGHETAATGVKTYTIDLSAPKAKLAEAPAEAAQTFVETTSASPSEVPELPQVAPSEAAQGAEPVLKAQGLRERDQRLLDQFSTQERPVAPPVEKPTIAVAAQVKPEGSNVALNAGASAVQVASFGVRATADRVAAELKAKGHSAYVTSFAAKGQTMYRVRVGPVADRAAAEALLQKIKPLHPDSAIASQ